MAKIESLIERARSNVSVREVFGEPYEKNGVTIVPVARVMGLGGGGGGTGQEGEGSGMGYGLRSEPVGVFAIGADGRVKWEPAVDVNKIVTGSFVVAIAWALASPRIAKHTAKWMKARR